MHFNMRAGENPPRILDCARLTGHFTYLDWKFLKMGGNVLHVHFLMEAMNMYQQPGI